MNEIKIEIVSSSGKPYYAHDMEFNVFTFPTAEHAEKYLKQVVGLSDEEIKALNIRFFYTNESKQCNCSLCEKRDDCHIRDKFQRLPRRDDGTGGLGMCTGL